MSHQRAYQKRRAPARKRHTAGTRARKRTPQENAPAEVYTDPVGDAGSSERNQPMHDHQIPPAEATKAVQASPKRQG
jgi:hypothetical protein